MSPTSLENGKPNVVIVGGGFGANVARTLSAKLDASAYNLVLINPRPYRVHLVACARLVVSDRDQLEKSVFGSYDKLFHNGNGTLIEASVKDVEKSEKSGGFVTLDNGEKIAFKVLVVATGSKWSGPLALPNSPDAITEFLATQRNIFSSAPSIVLAGAGSVGLELAGEIKDLWPSKPVTIVHNQSKVLNSAYPDKFRDRAARSISGRGVKLIFEDYVDASITGTPDSEVKTRGGKTLEPGTLIVPTWGTRPNTGMLTSLGPNTLTSDGYVKIRPTLQLAEHADIFALGDILDFKEQKSAANADAHASIVASNILSYLSTGEAKKIYKGSILMIALTNGKEDGVMYVGILWGITIGGWLTRLVKSRGLLIPMFRGSLGL